MTVVQRCAIPILLFVTQANEIKSSQHDRYKVIVNIKQNNGSEIQIHLIDIDPAFLNEENVFIIDGPENGAIDANVIAQEIVTLVNKTQDSSLIRAYYRTPDARLKYLENSIKKKIHLILSVLFANHYLKFQLIKQA